MAGTREEGADAGASDAGESPPVGEDGAPRRHRRRGVLAALPFLGIGLADVLLLLFWGIEPLWGFAILPPILFCSVLAYLVFSTDFLEGRT